MSTRWRVFAGCFNFKPVHSPGTGGLVPFQGVTAHGGPGGLCSLPASEASLGRQPSYSSRSVAYSNLRIVHRIFRDLN